MKTTKFLFASTALAAVLLSSACTLIYDSESSDTSDDTSSGISEPVSSDPKESFGNSEESSFDIGQVSKPVSSSSEESSDKPEDSKPESPDNSDISSSTISYEYEYIAPSEEEATSTNGTYTFFDFTYIRYQQPIFYSSMDDPNMIDWDINKIEEHMVVIEDPDYFKVKAGDKLENGLTVKSAGSIFECNDGGLNINEVEFDGNLTLEGILYCETYDFYTGDERMLYFFVDAAKSNPIPLVRTRNEPYFPDKTDFYINDDDKFAAIVDGDGIELGFIDEAPIDLSGIISPGECIRAKITVSNLRQRFSEYSMSFRRATLVSLEKLPD